MTDSYLLVILRLNAFISLITSAIIVSLLTPGALTVKISRVAEALAEKVVRNELREKDARRIGRQIMRENRLELFPQRKEQVSHEATSVR